MDRWKGRVALVTGASAGIGAVTAKELVRHGMKVVGCARDVEKIQKLAAECRSAGHSGVLVPFKCDLTNEEEILAMFTAIKAEHKGVDVCINNAGLGHSDSLLSGNTSGWKNMLDVNVLALSICTREAYQSMKERNVDDGHIIQINSISGHVVLCRSDIHFYTASKYAVTALTEGLRQELRELNSHIRATCISPGAVETEFAPRLFTNNPEKAANAYTGYKALEAIDVANAIIYALSAPPHVQKLSAECQSAGHSGILVPFKCDLSREEEILSMFAAIKAEHKGVDVCINNAGLGHPDSLLSGNTSGWKNMLDINVLALSICTREAYQSMKERDVDDGHIIHLNSMCGHHVRPIADMHFYNATKFAVTALTEGLRQELREINSHIRATCISPGQVETEIIQRFYSNNPEKAAAAAASYTKFKALEAIDVANAIIYILSAPPHVQIGDIQMRPVEQLM